MPARIGESDIFRLEIIAVDFLPQLCDESYETQCHRAAGTSMLTAAFRYCLVLLRFTVCLRFNSSAFPTLFAVLYAL